jgi:hypothetical protein
MLQEKASRRIAVDRSRKDIPLPQHAANGAKLPNLFFRLDSFSHDPDVHLLRGADKTLDYRQTHAIGFEMVDEHLVDFDDVDENRKEMRQRRKSCSKVVQRHTYATGS